MLFSNTFFVIFGMVPKIIKKEAGFQGNGGIRED